MCDGGCDIGGGVIDYRWCRTVGRRESESINVCDNVCCSNGGAGGDVGDTRLSPVMYLLVIVVVVVIMMLLVYCGGRERSTVMYELSGA